MLRLYVQCPSCSTLISTFHSRPHCYPTNFPHITLSPPPPPQLRHLSYLYGQRTGKLGGVFLFSVHISPSPLVSAITSQPLHPLDHLSFVAVKNSLHSWKMIISRGANFPAVFTVTVITVKSSKLHTCKHNNSINSQLDATITNFY